MHTDKENREGGEREAGREGGKREVGREREKERENLHSQYSCTGQGLPTHTLFLYNSPTPPCK